MATNYVDTVVWRLAAALPGCDIELLRLYALLALVRGADVTNEDVHDAWSVWTAASRPEHRSLVPFAELAPDVQELDTKYAEAIRSVAG